mgnify:CR=1 FL=1
MYESCRLTRRANDQSHTAHAIGPSPTTGTNVRTTRHESERSVVRPNIERTLVTILARWTTSWVVHSRRLLLALFFVRLLRARPHTRRPSN